jgi:signal transduction histidine kinase
VVSVHNEGEPIPEASVGQIFGPFRRRETGSRSEGLGLGLHICDQIVRAHGGQLSVTSTAPAGTTLRAVMPIVDRPAVPAGAPEQPAARPA